MNVWYEHFVITNSQHQKYANTTNSHTGLEANDFHGTRDNLGYSFDPKTGKIFQ